MPGVIGRIGRLGRRGIKAGVVVAVTVAGFLGSYIASGYIADDYMQGDYTE